MGGALFALQNVVENGEKVQHRPEQDEEVEERVQVSPPSKQI